MRTLHFFALAVAAFTVVGFSSKTLSESVYSLAAPANGCPMLSGDEVNGGEARCVSPSNGFTRIDNLDITTSATNNNGQSVILIAPSFRNGQNPWCAVYAAPGVCDAAIGRKDGFAFTAFLNNGMTEGDYFLQVGLFLSNRKSPNIFVTGVEPLGERV